MNEPINDNTYSIVVDLTQSSVFSSTTTNPAISPCTSPGKSAPTRTANRQGKGRSGHSRGQAALDGNREGYLKSEDRSSCLLESGAWRLTDGRMGLSSAMAPGKKRRAADEGERTIDSSRDAGGTSLVVHPFRPKWLLLLSPVTHVLCPFSRDRRVDSGTYRDYSTMLAWPQLEHPAGLHTRDEIRWMTPQKIRA